MIRMSEKRFERWNDHSCKVKDNQEDTFLNWEDVVDKLNEQQSTISQLKEENEQLQKENSAMKEEQNEMIAHLKKQNEQLKERNEKLQWELDKTREDLNYFANLKIIAIGGEPK